MAFQLSRLKRGDDAGAREALQRSLQSLARHKHVSVISRCGHAGCSISDILMKDAGLCRCELSFSALIKSRAGSTRNCNSGIYNTCNRTSPYVAVIGQSNRPHARFHVCVVSCMA